MVGLIRPSRCHLFSQYLLTPLNDLRYKILLLKVRIIEILKRETITVSGTWDNKENSMDDEWVSGSDWIVVLVDGT